MSEVTASVGTFSTPSVIKNDLRQLINELREQNFDSIRFATYRAACKLRFIQKKVNLHLVDIWNIIESFRENGLNAVDSVAEVKLSRMELLLSTVYHNLNKRLPVAQQVDTDRCISLLLSFLLGAYDREDTCRLRVFSIKVALATLCAGKLLDKLRYIFSQLCDSGGVLEPSKFIDYLREVLALPMGVFEGPSFGFTDQLGQTIFPPNSMVTVNTFLDSLMAEPCPPCLMWLPLMHRMSSVEHVFHPVQCHACSRESFTGFRYKCQRCHNYQLCQECFWRGRVSDAHTNQHEMKEYSSYKSPAKQLGHSIGKSMRCTPGHAHGQVPVFPDRPDRPLDLANVVPATPSLVHHPALVNRGDVGRYYDDMSNHSGGEANPARQFLTDASNLDDEHKLIARYSAKLAGRTSYPVSRTNDENNPEGCQQRATIARLEQRNKDIMREIERLQVVRTGGGSMGSGLPDVGMGGELGTLRSRKSQLEGRMGHLQDTRRELMGQLDTLMRQLRTTQTPREGSPRSPSLSGVGGEVRSAFGNRAGSMPVGQPGKGATLQGDLLSAADSITNTMSTLVKELGSESTIKEGVIQEDL